ncbi:MAG: hypothetical protein IT193_01010 [Propionibacteriaceae bacterium]|nr:hypothetical protein [Propionibacteriaceae bacterium]
MTMTEDFEREERAFAEALRGSVPVETFRPLDPEELKAAAAPGLATRGRWLKGLAAAAAVVVVAGAGVLVLPQLGGGAGSSAATVAGLPEAAGGAAPMDAEDRASAAESKPVLTSASGEWAGLPEPPLSPRSNSAGAWLDGEFFLVGGQLSAPCPPNADCMAPDRLLRDGAAFNPANGTWRRIADAPVALSEGEPVVVAGRLYFQRGYGPTAAVYAYDAGADAWSQLPTPSGGGVLVALGDRLASVAWSTEEAGAFDELFDPVTGQWTRLPADPLKAAYERTLVPVAGRALLFAKAVPTGSGVKAPVFRLAELDLATGKWRRLPDSDVVGVAGRAVGDLVVFPETGSYDGGDVDNWGRDYPAGGIFDPATGLWSELPAPAKSDDGLRHGRTTVAGALLLTDSGLLDPVGRSWSTVPQPPGGNLLGQAVVAGPDGLLVFGGWDGSGPTAAAAYLPLR